MTKYVWAVLGLVFLVWLLALAGSAWGAGTTHTYTVNTTSHTNDWSCDALDSGDCTLWEAIYSALPGGIDTIAFDIPITDTNYSHNTAGVWTIVLTQTLPSLVSTIVDGTTQATNLLSDTNSYGPEIEISGEGLPLAQSCWIIGSNNVIKGLAINRCPTYGLVVNGDDNTIIANYIGTDATGSSDVSTTWDGITLGNGTENNTIGGPSEAERNVISGMGGGIRIFQTPAVGNTTGNVIEGNYIGTDRTGTAPLPNDDYGVKIESGAHDNTVGPNNVIAYNSMDGVWVDGGGTISNTITQNSIHSNGGLGILLMNGGNTELTAPTIALADCLSLYFGTAPSNATVELFTGPDEEGKTYLTTVSADGGGDWILWDSFTLDTYVTATATDAAGNTSEFSTQVSPGPCHQLFAPLVTKNY